MSEQPKASLSKRCRWLQWFTFIHRVHHVTWSYGYVFTPLGLGYFERYGCRRVESYHDCTRTGVY